MSIKKNIFAPLASGLGATRRAAMMLLVMMLTTATAWAQTTSTINVGGTDYTLFTGFTATGGSSGSGIFTYDKMVDGDVGGNSSFHEFANVAYVEFNSDEPIIPKGYIVNLYNFNSFNQKPNSWVLKARVNAGDEWTELSSYSGQNMVSEQQYACNNEENNAYKYFRFEASNSNNNIWLTEIRLYGSIPNVYYTHLTVKDATCTETGIKQNCYQRNDGKYFTDETGTTELQESDVIAPMIPHSGEHHEATDVNIEYWQCSMCSKYFSDGAYTTEITEEDTKIYRTITIDNGISGLVTSSVDKALAGATVTLTVSHLIDTSTLQVNSGSVTLTEVGGGTYTFTIPAADVIVTASILSTYSITLPANMAIVGVTNAADSNGKYISGTVIKFAASLGYEATNVSDGTNTLEPDADGIYTVTVAEADINITATTESSNTIYLARATTDFTAVDGNILIGSTSHTVTIANNAKITLNNATITGGIVCAGTAEITLVGTNSVSGATNTAGIQIGGSGTTLTIKGDGSLTANGGAQSAGIGLSRAWDPANDVIGGDIVIEGGNITANGGSQWGAGIGTGVIYGNGSAKTARIGNITIKGGTVKATGGTSADGIGTGYTYTLCTNAIGTVTIYDGIDKVDASSIKNSGSIVYKHDETDVTASKSDYFTIIENGNRRIIVQKVTPAIADVPDQTYTGSAITPEPTVIAGSLNLTKGTDYVYSYTNNTNVGTAKVIATFQGDYASLGSVEKEFTIVKATPAVTAPTAVADLVYNGSAQALVNAGSTDFGTLLYSLDGTNYSDAIPTATDAGTYTIYYKVEGSSNWYAVDAATVEATIANYVASLADNADNTNDINNIITNYDSKADVTLSGRTLYKDGYWNTLVLPFDVTIASSPLAGDNVVAKVLNESSNLVGGTLTLNFDNAPATIPAGTPFIIKWDNTGVNLVNPVFTGVTIDNTNRDVNFTGGSGSFMGTYAPLEITEANRSKVLLLSGGNKLGYAKTDRTIANGKALGTCRAYFYFSDSQTARSFVLNFEEEGTTSLREKGIVKSEEFLAAAEWYTLDGVKLSGKPTKKGLYIHGGKKVVVH